MSNEHALAQYQKRVDDECFESDFIESKFIEAREELQADILEMLEAKRYLDIYADFFKITDFDFMDHVFNEYAKKQLASRNEREP